MHYRLQASTTTFYHVVGNHCLSVPRERLVHELKMPGSYYSRQLSDKWRLIVLDTTEISGHSQYSQVYFFKYRLLPQTWVQAYASQDRRFQ